MNLYELNLNHQTLIIIGIVIFTYILSITIIGSLFAGFNKSLDDFFYSGQRFSWWLPAASMVATGIGSYSFLKYSEQGYLTGTSSALTYLNDWFVIPFFIFGWLPIIYYSRVKSIPEYFERRFNKTAKIISLIIILAYMFFYIGYNFYTMGVALEGLFGLSQIISVPILALFLCIYVTLGGQTAVIITDLFQGILLYLAGAIALFAGISALGGLDQFWGYLPVSYRLPFVDLTQNENFNTAGLFWGEALAGSIAFAFMNQGFIMRYLTIKSVNEGKKAAFFNLLITMPVSAVVVGGIGWIGKALIIKQTATGGALPGIDFVAINNSYHTFITVCWVVVKNNPWLFGFIIATLLAALMSTIDTLINACAAIIIYDLYKPLIKKTDTEAHYLNAARIISVISTLIGLSLVIIFNLQQNEAFSLMALHYKGIMIIIPSIVTTIFMGAFWPKFHAKAANIAMISGSLLTVLTLWFPNLITPLSTFVTGSTEPNYIYMRALFGMLTTATIGWLCTYIFNPDQNIEPGLTIFSLKKAKQNYKQNESINEIPAKPIRDLTIEIDETIALMKIIVPIKYMQKLHANDEDLIYISDNRLFLGGLRAGHVKAYGLKGNGVNDSIRMSTQTLNHCYLIKDKTILLEKIF